MRSKEHKMHKEYPGYGKVIGGAVLAVSGAGLYLAEKVSGPVTTGILYSSAIGCVWGTAEYIWHWAREGSGGSYRWEQVGEVVCDI